MKKYWSAILAVLCLLTGCGAQAIPPEPAEPVRIACIGDSVTYGYGLDRTASYPAQLQQLLGEQHIVENFGVNGAAVLDYRSTPAYAAALEFEPDIIVIMLGSNDTNAALWSDRDTFAARYGDLVDAISATGAELILCTCSAAYPIHGGYQFGVDPEALDQVCDVIRQTAADRNLPLADIAAVTADQPQWYETDGVHPNADGAAAIAVAIAAAITG